MDALQLWRSSTLAERTVTALENHGFTARYMQDGSSALAYILKRIPDHATVGIGGSKTEKTLGIAKALAAKSLSINNLEKMLSFWYAFLQWRQAYEREIMGSV